jgi:hypothetical protein
MSYVDHCKKHGQYHGEICGECFEDLKVENTRLLDALHYIAFASPDQCEDIRFGIENNCLAEVYKAEAYRTLWEEE